MTTAARDLRYFIIRELGCLACFIEGLGYVPCQIHHLNKGDQPGRERRGDSATVGLCEHHHTGRCACTGKVHDCEACYSTLGPSWWHHKRAFIEKYGDGTKLLAIQDERIASWNKQCV